MGEPGHEEDRDGSFDPVVEAGGCLATVLPTAAAAVAGVATIVYGVVHGRLRRARRLRRR